MVGKKKSLYHERSSWEKAVEGAKSLTDKQTIRKYKE